jgi:hypothetical protein
MISNKTLSTTKFHNFLRSTTFISVVLSSEIVWKTQKIRIKMISSADFLKNAWISTSGFLNEPSIEI